MNEWGSVKDRLSEIGVVGKDKDVPTKLSIMRR